jgi:LmbE family N-acetylglucosaminyl deacetylase
VSPHTDDGELGAGGTMARFIGEGSKVTYLAFSAPRIELHHECENSLKVLGVKNHQILNFPRRHFPEHRQEILQILYDFNQEHNVDLVLTPSTMDNHQDHQTITNEVLRAFKHSSILGYELAWNHIIFRENCFIALKEKHVHEKLESLSCYKTQEKKNYFNREYLRSLMRSRGLQINEKYSEAFEVIKIVLGLSKTMQNMSSYSL